MKSSLLQIRSETGCPGRAAGTLAGAALFFIAGAAGAIDQQPPKAFHEWTGSRTVPAHRINLYDENGGKIVPVDQQSMPFSARKTCGTCHDYEKISRGWHFNYADTNAPKGRGGQPWIWLDEVTGMQLPVAQRGWTNTWKIADAGLTPWTFIRTFGRHLPGGGLGDIGDDPDDLNARWAVSGPLEINCLMCHGGSAMQDTSEWAKQIGRENFRWAATAASGIGDVGGMASRVRTTWDYSQGPNKDDSEYAVSPYVRYDAKQFDRKNRAFVDIALRPADKQCQYCHSVAADGLLRKDLEADVHTVAGIGCVECHRNGIDHMVTRGFEGATNRLAAASSCRGCHLGARGGSSPGGRLGAPVPEHKGLPPAHLKKLACTACHSGPLPAAQPIRIRTARANRLGIFGIARWDTDLPYIVEPVFMKGEDGKIAPHRMVWPAFWARLEQDRVKPLKPEEVAAAATDILDTSKKLSAMMRVLSVDVDTFGSPVFICGGRVLRPNVDGGVDADQSSDAVGRQESGWAVVLKGKVCPLLPEFDPSAETLDRELDMHVVDVLKALAGAASENQGVPVLIAKDRVMRLGENEVLLRNPLKDEVDEIAGGAAALKSAAGGILPGWLKDRKVAPLVSDFIVRSVGETVGTSFTMTEEQAAAVLKALAAAEPGGKAKFAYFCSGRMFTLDSSGKLAAGEHPAAEPCAWPLAHDVRPAGRSLGVVKCAQCHSAGSPFFFGKVAASGPMKTDRVQVRRMHELEGLDPAFNRLFGLSFLVRVYYKVALAATAALIGSVLLLYGLLALRRVTVFFSSRKESR